MALGIELKVNRNRWYLLEFSKRDGAQAERRTRQSLNIITYVGRRLHEQSFPAHMVLSTATPSYILCLSYL